MILARSGSKRFPNKVLKKLSLNGPLVIEYIIEKIKKCKNIEKIVLATSKNSADDIIVRIAKEKKILAFRGSETNVLDRLIRASTFTKKKYKYIVRANADCPFFMPHILDLTIKKFIKSKKDLYSPFYDKKYPFGFSFCIFKIETLLKIKKLTSKKKYLEHIENFCFDNMNLFKILKIKKDKYHLPTLKLTLDTPKDFIKLKKIYKKIKMIKYNDQPLFLINFFKQK